MDELKKQLAETELDNVNGGILYDDPQLVVYKYKMNDVVDFLCRGKDGLSAYVKKATVCNRGYKEMYSHYVPCYLLSCDGAIGWYIEDSFDEKKRLDDVDWTE